MVYAPERLAAILPLSSASSIDDQGMTEDVKAEMNKNMSELIRCIQ